VVGVQADEFGALVSAVHVVVKREGTVLQDETWPVGPSAATPSLLPKEFALTGAVGAAIEVSATAISPSNGTAVVARLASARLVRASDSRKLLRVQLENRCIQFPGGPDLACAEPLTCVAGTCASSAVAEENLEDYEPGWALAPPDICRPAKHGAPEVRLGTGQTDYATLEDGQVLQLEKGPQGGHHIWIATRMRNLRQSGSTTSISSTLEGDPGPVPPTSFVFTYEQDEGAYCKIWGLRYQVDAGATDLRNAYRRFLGKRLVVTVEVKDSTGTTATSTKTVQLADKLLCPDGTDACNQP
jgi:hypothetical protein